MRKTLKIGITCFPTFGGSGVVASEVGMAMARKGHKVHFISYDFPRRLNRFMENIFFHEVETREYPLFDQPQYPLNLASKMVEVCTFVNLDILHVHYAIPHATSAYLARQILGDKAPKIITTLHGTDITLVGKDRSYLPIARFSIEQSDGVTVPSFYLKNATYDKLNLSPDKEIKVINNFVDTNYFSPAEEKNKKEIRAYIDKCLLSDFVITHVSNFRPVKRLNDVIKVFELINKEVPSHLVLVGDGPERSAIESYVRDLGLEDKVCFLGKLDNFAPILRQSDIFLLPSESESFGLAALEAMSCGLPVIASNTQGIPEVVTDGVNGYLSEVGDVEDMAAKALSLFRDKKKYLSFSTEARRAALQNFGQEMLISQYEDYYYTLLNQKL